jgi:signal peptidase I
MRKKINAALLLLSVFAFRSSLADQYVIPSGSMEPTIQVGDHVLVDKRAYDLKIPFTHVALAHMADPKRGDIVVFLDPRNPRINLIKRLIGLPGDRVRVRNGLVEVNGSPLETSIGDERAITRRLRESAVSFGYEEALPGGPAHRIQRLPWLARSRDQEFTVPAGHYFFLGDNRDNSADSREWGFAEKSALLGRAVGVLYSVTWDGIVPRPSLSRFGAAL